jgi:hypothetical protein
MSATGDSEATAILGRLSTIASSRIFEGIPDDTALAFNSDGTVKPFVDVSFGVPVPAARDRRLGVDESQQQHYFPISITSIAGTKALARKTDQDVGSALLGWIPSAPDSGEITGIGGGSAYTIAQQAPKPSRFARTRYMQVLINMSTTA